MINSTLWQQELANAFRKPEDLLSFLQISEPSLVNKGFSKNAHSQFNTLVTRSFANKMQKGNLNDPLLIQVLPSIFEEEDIEGFKLDAVGDQKAQLNNALIQKYSSRALLISTGACAIHCRYCFRRHFPYRETAKQVEAWLEQLNPLNSRPEINEVILSGGDPLMLRDDRISLLINRLADFKNIKTLRIHSRIPSVLPERIHGDFNDLFKEFKGQKVMVWHVNHPNELDQITFDVAQYLSSNLWIQLNQSVLLKGVNDDFKIQKELSHKLFSQGILPYYLHQLDRVKGAAHFEVPKTQGLKIVDELREGTSGYLVPKYVCEIEGLPSKTPVVSLNPLQK